MAQQQINPGSAPIIWSDVASAFDTINDNFTELYASVGGDAVDFTSLGTNLVPRDTEVYDLGTSAKRWRDLWLSGSSIHLGDAVITSTGTTINLPVGSTIGGLRVDENYFKFISVAGQDTIEADDGTDTLTLASGNSGITLATNASTDTVTITNSGVTSLAGTAGQIGVSQSTGGVTLTNLGVTSVTAGQGVSLSSGTGSVTITNSGLVGLDAGIGIQLSPRDLITGVVTITNSQPNVPQQVFSTIAVPTQSPIAADSTADTLTIQTSGDGLSITTAPITDTLTFTNTGVTSLAVGSGLTIDAGTGSINLTLDAVLSRNLIGDVTGSIFADDSSIIIDSIDQKIYADGGFFGDLEGDTTGYHTGDVRGSVFANDSSLLVDGVDGNIYVPNNLYAGMLTLSDSLIMTELGNSLVLSAGEDVQLNGTTDVTITSDSEGSGYTWIFAQNGILTAPGAIVGNLNGSVTGNIFTTLIDSADSSAITITPAAIFSSDVTVENELFIGTSRVIAVDEIKSIVAASTDFADFQARIAAL
jgi:hypothetical protein